MVGLGGVAVGQAEPVAQHVPTLPWQIALIAWVAVVGLLVWAFWWTGRGSR